MTSFYARLRAGLGALVIVAVVLAPAGLSAQEVPEPSAPAPAAEALVAAQDTTLSAQSALIRSLVLPGWGQTYVGAHGRGAFYFALEAGSLWMVYKSSRALASARRLEASMRENNALGATQRLPLAESRSQQVEDWITLSVFWALFAGADAYVSAQLADFAGHVGAAPGPAGEMRFQVQFDVGGPR